MQELNISYAVNCLDDLHTWLLDLRGSIVKKMLIYAVYGACEYIL